MPQTVGIAAVCGQALGVPGNDASVGREPGGLDVGNEFAQEVSEPGLECCSC